MAMSAEERKAIIEEDFRWLQDIKVHEINGKPMMGDNDLPYNIGHVFYEDEFVKKWLMPFALGNYYGINYFPVQSWCAFSNNGTRAVLVVNDNHEPVLLIPPLVAHKLSAEDFMILRAASWHMHNNSHDTQRGKSPNLNLEISNALTKHLDNTRRVTYTDMILPEYFEKKGVIPEVEQKIYYIKDVVRANDKADIAEITKLRPLMYKHHRGEKLTKEEIAFVKDVSRGQFAVTGEVTSAGEPEEKQDTAPNDPMEC